MVVWQAHLEEARMSSLTVIVPTHNPSYILLEELERVARAHPDWQLLIIDDHSAVEVATYLPAGSSLQISRNPNCLGAGACRNLGISKIERKYTLFLDDDDNMHWDIVDSAIAKMEADQSIDVCFFLYDLLYDGQRAAALARDQCIMAEALQGKAERIITPKGNERLLAFTNYPWNKIYRSSFVQSAGLRFSATAVQNDIYAHWLTFLKARTINLQELILCTKVEYSSAERIGNLADSRCLEAFEALQEIYQLVQNEGWQAAKDVFLPYYLDLVQWRLSIAADELRHHFYQLHIAFVEQMEADGFLDSRKQASPLWMLWELPVMNETMENQKFSQAKDIAARDAAILLTELSRLKRLSHELRNANTRLQEAHAQMMAEISDLRSQNNAIRVELDLLRNSIVWRFLRKLRRLTRWRS
jgi:glycosyltransferase involved in cell wall biosynthesis